MQRQHDDPRTTPTTARRAAGALVLGAALLLGACGTDDADQAAILPAADRATTTSAAPDPVPGPTVAPEVTTPAPLDGEPAVVATPDAEAPVTTAPPTTVSPAPPPLEDGRHFGYLVGYELDSSATAASFDLAQLLTGDEADRAAAEDGVIQPGEQVDNDVYIRNVNPRLRRALFRDDARITVLDCTHGCSEVPSDRATLQNRPTPTPVWLTVEGGVVVAAAEVYLP